MQITKYHQNTQDPIKVAQHGQCYRYWFGKVPVNKIQPSYDIDEFCHRVNREIADNSTSVFESDDGRSFELSQFVKINLLYHSLRREPNIKPWLLCTDGHIYRTCTGDTRRRALEFLPSITEIEALICAPWHVNLAYQSINCFDDLVQAFQVPLGTAFYFTIAKPDAGYGMEWYEVALDYHTNTVGPTFRDWCQTTIQRYMRQQPRSFRLHREWFTQDHNWESYQ